MDPSFHLNDLLFIFQTLPLRCRDFTFFDMDQFSFPAANTPSGITTLRPSSPDSIAPHESVTPARRVQNPFQSPFTSGPTSRNASSSAVNMHHQQLGQKYFHSRRVKKGEIERPWLDKKDPREKWVTIIPLIGLFIGLAFAGFLIYDGLKAVINHEYCPILDEDFSRGLDPKIWTKEAEVGGFGFV